MPSTPDWNARYETGDTPWEVGGPSPELQRVLREFEIPRGRALEMGCGAGHNAVWLSQQGFGVTAFDLSTLAIERARAKAVAAGVSVEFLAAGFEELPEFESPFVFLFDRGFYHVVRKDRADAILEVVRRVLAPGGYWLSLMGNANEPREYDHGPPRVTATEICQEWERDFELIQLREFHFDGRSAAAPFRPLAWSVLARRRSRS